MRILTVVAVLMVSSGLAALERDELHIRISVKRVLNSDGQPPDGRWGSTSEIVRTIERCNAAMERSDSNWIFDLVEIVDASVPAYYEMSSSRMSALERAALSDPAYLWNDEAVNIYVVNRITDAGGVCSFPSLGTHHQTIIINSQGILGGSEGWLHEIGHYFNLFHTHDGDLVVDTVDDTSPPSPFSCSVHDDNFLAASAAAGVRNSDRNSVLYNVMSYHCDPRILTPLQLVRMERALRFYRPQVIVTPDPIDPPVALITPPPEVEGGSLDVSGDEVELVFDSSQSDPGGSDDFTSAWRITEAPAGGAEILSGDGAWLRGISGFGYGDGDDFTVLSDMERNYVSIFLAREFEVEEAVRVSALTLEVTYDDGFAAYLNGVEVARRNLAPGAAWNADADSSIDPIREFIDLSPFLGELVSGRNRLAIEAHNSSRNSSDLSMHPLLLAEIDDDTSMLIPALSPWFYRKGSAGAPPADWNTRDFDPASRSLRLMVREPGSFTVELTVDNQCGSPSTSSSEFSFDVVGSGFVRGDCNRDAVLDLSDAIRGLLVLFADGNATNCPDACDANDDESHDLSDSVYVLSFLFRGGPAPGSPYPTRGEDPTGEALGCDGG